MRIPQPLQNFEHFTLKTVEPTFSTLKVSVLKSNGYFVVERDGEATRKRGLGGDLSRGQGEWASAHLEKG